MSGAPPAAFLDFLEQRRREFARGLLGRLAQIEGEWRALGDGHADEGAVDRLAIAAHSLAGAAPLFGFDELGRAARELQREAEAVARSGAPGGESRAALRAALARVRASIRP